MKFHRLMISIRNACLEANDIGENNFIVNGKTSYGYFLKNGDDIKGLCASKIGTTRKVQFATMKAFINYMHDRRGER